MGWMMPLAGVVADMLFSRRPAAGGGAGAATGAQAKEVVAQMGEAVDRFMERDERLLQLAHSEVQDARRHDTAIGNGGLVLVDLLRGLVRPGITLAVFIWYIYARLHGIALSAEDYALVGGVLAFWFGMRLYEKQVGRTVDGGVGGRTPEK